MANTVLNMHYDVKSTKSPIKSVRIKMASKRVLLLYTLNNLDTVDE